MVPVASTLHLLASLYLAGQAFGAAIDTRASLSAYAPISVSCPSTSLLRSADGISSDESTYITARKTKADTSLAEWLTATNSAFSTETLPTLALSLSGGGLRALMCGAGVIQAFDSRDSTAATSGLYQSLTYQIGLSGGAWLTSSIAGNNWPTVSELQTSLWDQAFQDSLLLPDNLLAAVAYAEIVDDIVSKSAAGYEPTIVDVWGRLLGYQLLKGSDGGVDITLSSVTSLSNFTDHNVSLLHLTRLWPAHA